MSITSAVDDRVPSSSDKKTLSKLHHALKLVARSVDQLQVHHYTSVRKVLTEQLGPHIRLGSKDMLELKHSVSRLGTTYCELEQYLTHWAMAGKDHSLRADVPYTAVVANAEQLRNDVLQAHDSLVDLLEHLRSTQAQPNAEQDELSRYLVHFKYYAALMQHMRFKGISWLSDTVVSGYLRSGGMPEAPVRCVPRTTMHTSRATHSGTARY